MATPLRSVSPSFEGRKVRTPVTSQDVATKQVANGDQVYESGFAELEKSIPWFLTQSLGKVPQRLY